MVRLACGENVWCQGNALTNQVNESCHACTISPLSLYSRESREPINIDPQHSLVSADLHKRVLVGDPVRLQWISRRFLYFREQAWVSRSSILTGEDFRVQCISV